MFSVWLPVKLSSMCFRWLLSENAYPVFDFGKINIFRTDHVNSNGLKMVFHISWISFLMIRDKMYIPSLPSLLVLSLWVLFLEFNFVLFLDLCWQKQHSAKMAKREVPACWRKQLIEKKKLIFLPAFVHKALLNLCGSKWSFCFSSKI